MDSKTGIYVVDVDASEGFVLRTDVKPNFIDLKTFLNSDETGQFTQSTTLFYQVEPCEEY
jgi:hypothetical protein